MINQETKDLIEKIKSDMQFEMSEKRFKHSISVMEMCLKLAKCHNLDENEAALAGLTHDIAKEIPDEIAYKMLDEEGLQLDEIEKKTHSLIHQKVGAIVVKNKYGLSENIQKAIMYHTCTSPDMNDLGKVLFLADKIADGREGDYPLIEEYRETAKRNLDEAIIMILDNNIKYLIDKEKTIHPNAVLTRNKLIEDRSN